MMSSWRHSVATVKLRTSQNPKIPIIRFPGIMGTMLVPVDMARLFPMIDDPASPNPIWSSAEHLMSASTMVRVSPSLFRRYSVSSWLTRDMGSFEMRVTILAIVSRGSITSMSMSRPSSALLTPKSTAMTKTVTTLLTASVRCGWTLLTTRHTLLDATSLFPSSVCTSIRMNSPSFSTHASVSLGATRSSSQLSGLPQSVAFPSRK
mmetsp:Transcript_51434/g.122470  ORF Transcript_51434/g.122470 Transcript_51434/m.122470 type:complete len:206 (-) Transcript_51434:125-742(-)